MDELSGSSTLTREEALELLRHQFHKTRFTKEIHVDPNIIAAILGYEIRTFPRRKMDEY